jgi:outer membrane protein assembly factor BamE (lipoprotein component of BamABCDE complex)
MASAPGTIRRLALCTSICILAGVGALTAACTAQLDTHGDHIEADRLAQIRPGVQTREDVAQLLGSPSSTSVFDSERWYYISDMVETRSIFDREVKERQVVTIRFNREGVVSEVDDFGLERGREVELVERETPSFGESVNFFNQVVGNLGRFNNAGSGQQRRGPPSPYGGP